MPTAQAHRSAPRVGLVGGSIAGCTAAVELGRAGHDVSVFERSPGAPAGRGGHRYAALDASGSERGMTIG